MNKLLYVLNVFFSFSAVFIKSLFSKNKREVLLAKFQETYYTLKKTVLPGVYIDELVLEGSLCHNKTRSVNGNVSEQESLAISRIVLKNKPMQVFEIGTFNGRTTCNIAKHLPEGGKIYSLDLLKAEKPNTKFKTIIYEKVYINYKNKGKLLPCVEDLHQKIQLLYGDSAVFDFSPYIKKMDIVFIDGSHAYDYVINDTKAAIKLLKPQGGIILWHDYNSATYHGLTKAIHELRNNYECLKTMKLILGTSLIYCDTRED